MISLREFLKLIRSEHYRVYYPNRDCLFFESFLVHHSPYRFPTGTIVMRESPEYYQENRYNDAIRHKGWRDPAYDEETKEFLERFGEKFVHSVEISSFLPFEWFHDDNGNMRTNVVKNLPGQDDFGYIECFDIFICDYSPFLDKGCMFCPRAIAPLTPGVPAARVGDPGDPACRGCKWFANPSGSGEESHEETSL